MLLYVLERFGVAMFAIAVRRAGSARPRREANRITCPLHTMNHAGVKAGDISPRSRRNRWASRLG